jgi:hypothetical protein
VSQGEEPLGVARAPEVTSPNIYRQFPTSAAFSGLRLNEPRLYRLAMAAEGDSTADPWNKETKAKFEKYTLPHYPFSCRPGANIYSFQQAPERMVGPLPRSRPEEYTMPEQERRR